MGVIFLFGVVFFCFWFAPQKMTVLHCVKPEKRFYEKTKKWQILTVEHEKKRIFLSVRVCVHIPLRVCVHIPLRVLVRPIF